MGKNPNTFQKRQREFEKKRKAEDKRKRRQAQKDMPKSLDANIAVEKDDDPDDPAE